MAARRVIEAGRKAECQLRIVVSELRDARLAAGLSQAAVARPIGISRPLLSEWERGIIVPNPIQLAEWGAVLGLDLPVRAFPAGSPLRDAG